MIAIADKDLYDASIGVYDACIVIEARAKGFNYCIAVVKDRGKYCARFCHRNPFDDKFVHQRLAGVNLPKDAFEKMKRIESALAHFRSTDYRKVADRIVNEFNKES